MFTIPWTEDLLSCICDEDLTTGFDLVITISWDFCASCFLNGGNAMSIFLKRIGAFLILLRGRGVLRDLREMSKLNTLAIFSAVSGRKGERRIAASLRALAA